MLKSLSEAAGVSGHEDNVRSLIELELRQYCEEIHIGKLGSVVARKVGRQDGEPRRCVMLAAHLDEIGMMVTGIEKSFLRVAAVGGIDVRVLPGQEVLVHGRKALPGIVACRPPHVLSAEEREKVIPLSNLFVDVGLSEEEVKRNVSIGDIISFDRKVISLTNDVVAGKSFDNRASVTALVLVAQMLAGMSHDWDVCLVATSQEEVGLYGAVTSTYAVRPDLGIAIDVGFGDMPDVRSTEAITLGKGPGLTVGPNIHPVIHRKLADIAKETEIPIQTTAEPGDTGTDAWAMQVTGIGVPTALLSIPLRYMHTTVETVSLLDIERVARLLVAFIASLGPETTGDLEYSL